MDRDTLLLPEIVIEAGPPATLDATLSTLRPAFDVLWQAAGYERSFNFDDSGAWKG